MDEKIPTTENPYSDPLDERYVAMLDHNSSKQVELRAKQDEERQRKAKKIAGKLRRRKAFGRTAMVVNRNSLGKSPPDQDVYRFVDQHLERHNIKTEVHRIATNSGADPIPDQDIIRIKSINGEEVPPSSYWRTKTDNQGLGGSVRIHPPESPDSTRSE